ncbi:MAG: DUF362 domain-containing protein [Treponema sp.]|jgi:uncharacterized protein (DUF362 family)|nr:DUF362 domain-containing protein [Treponema sp.]
MEADEILVCYGGDPAAMARRIAEAADLAGLIGDRNKRIGLKPNLVVARPAAEGATTHPEIAGGLIEYLQARGFHNLAILEGSWVGDRTEDAFRVCGYRDLAARTGVELIDTQRDSARPRDCGGMRIEICDSALGVDFMINLPVMKGHCQTLVTCALKNNKGIIPNREKRRFHTLGLHRPIACLNIAARNDFIVVDGICGDLDFEEGGNPVFGGRIFAARDPVLCDAWAAEQMGYQAEEIPYIGLAAGLGIGRGDPAQARVRELNRPGEAGNPSGPGDSGSPPRPGSKVRQAARYIHGRDACSACYAAAVFALSRLDRGELARLGEKIALGQGFRGRGGRLGSGNCCSSFDAFCPGCPPSGAAVLAFLRAWTRRL